MKTIAVILKFHLKGEAA